MIYFSDIKMFWGYLICDFPIYVDAMKIIAERVVKMSNMSGLVWNQNLGLWNGLN